MSMSVTTVSWFAPRLCKKIWSSRTIIPPFPHATYKNGLVPLDTWSHKSTYQGARKQNSSLPKPSKFRSHSDAHTYHSWTRHSWWKKGALQDSIHPHVALAPASPAFQHSTHKTGAAFDTTMMSATSTAGSSKIKSDESRQDVASKILVQAFPMPPPIPV